MQKFINSFFVFRCIYFTKYKSKYRKNFVIITIASACKL